MLVHTAAEAETLPLETPCLFFFSFCLLKLKIIIIGVFSGCHLQQRSSSAESEDCLSPGVVICSCSFARVMGAAGGHLYETYLTPQPQGAPSSPRYWLCSPLEHLRAIVWHREDETFDWISIKFAEAHHIEFVDSVLSAVGQFMPHLA